MRAFNISMIENVFHVRHGSEIYSQAVMRLNMTYGLGLRSENLRTAHLQETKMRFSHDTAHTNTHLLGLAHGTELMIERRPSLIGEIDWPLAFDFYSLHDEARASFPVNIITLFYSQWMEYKLAPIAARKHLEHHRFGKVNQELLDIIARHPFHAGHRTRQGKVFSPTEQLVVDVDGLEVLSPKRVDAMYAHIKNGFFGLPLERDHGLIYAIFRKYTNFTFFYPEANAIAQELRPAVEDHIQKKFIVRSPR